MNRRQTSDPTREYADGKSYLDKGDYIENHPAFGVAVITRGSGSGRALFQSDLLHNETITLSIRRAERGRSLMHDWVHPKKELVEVEMSLAQWGALVSSIGLGSGVPVTIRSTEDNHWVDELPYQPRIAEVVGEARGAVSKLMDRIRDRFDVLKTAFDEKQGVKAQREAMNSLGNAIAGAESNTEFAVKSVTNATEHVVGQARADIESQILTAAQITGQQASISAPSLDLKEIEGA